jgi:hypothetical protein
MTNTIEPTEDQRMAAAHYYANGRELTPYIAAWVKTGEGCEGDNVDSLARLLAEREAALLALVRHAQMSSMARAADLDAARARIAELEAQLAGVVRGDGAALLNCEHNNMREMRDQFVSTLIATAHYDVESERIAHAIVERLTGVKR